MNRLILIAVFSTALSPTVFPAGAYDREKGVRLFYRILGSKSNGPFVRKTRSVAAPDYAPRTASTGMANAGFTEYPFCSGEWSFSFRERFGLFPRFASGVRIDPNRVNTCDILVDWVYEPDGCVWGPACREFWQTFVATGKELVAVTLLVASKQGTFAATVHEGGPDGRQVGPPKTFVSGHSMEWGTARWAAGEARLEPGKTYCIRLRREDGEAWNPYFHSTGNVYDKGHAYFDGVPRPESDLALWIMTEPSDVSRSLVLDADSEGWIRSAPGFRFVPRTKRIRMITAELAPVQDFCVHLVGFVWQLEPQRRLICGPKYTVACARPNTCYEGSFLFGPDELVCTPGRACFVEVFTVPFLEGREPDIPVDRSELPRSDIRPIVYGQTRTQAPPVIYNVSTSTERKESLSISWQLSRHADTKLEIVRPEDKRKTILIPAGGRMNAVITGLPAGAECDFRLTASEDARRTPALADYTWRTPLYSVRMPGGQPPPIIWPETPEEFVPIAPKPDAEPACAESSAVAGEIELQDGGFEQGLGAWKETAHGVGRVSPGEAGIAPFSGNRMYGWTHRAGANRRDVLLENGIYRTIPVKPGHLYCISVQGITNVGAGPRGDTRIRLAADPNGTMELKGRNSSQWFWTDARWMRICHSFRATSKKATIFVGFFRWRDLDRASAYVDDIRLHDLGPSQ
jgi:hypothetical protein